VEEEGDFKMTPSEKAQQEEISGLFPHYVVAPTKGGKWAGFLLNVKGYSRLTIICETSDDAAAALTCVLREPA